MRMRSQYEIRYHYWQTQLPPDVQPRYIRQLASRDSATLAEIVFLIGERFREIGTAIAGAFKK